MVMTDREQEQGLLDGLATVVRARTYECTKAGETARHQRHWSRREDREAWAQLHLAQAHYGVSAVSAFLDLREFWDIRQEGTEGLNLGRVVEPLVQASAGLDTRLMRANLSGLAARFAVTADRLRRSMTNDEDQTLMDRMEADQAALLDCCAIILFAVRALYVEARDHCSA
jgi:hypothetical protein